jgi:hypothetical protein
MATRLRICVLGRCTVTKRKLHYETVSRQPPNQALGYVTEAHEQSKALDYRPPKVN